MLVFERACPGALHLQGFIYRPGPGVGTCRSAAAPLLHGATDRAVTGTPCPGLQSSWLPAIECPLPSISSSITLLSLDPRSNDLVLNLLKLKSKTDQFCKYASEAVSTCYDSDIQNKGICIQTFRHCVQVTNSSCICSLTCLGNQNMHKIQVTCNVQ